ncbi:hypothetical protein AGABI2DRAFT_116710 [Agaricus bisporus var. bisporus H97]|uniref:hypothetical protein n=1 Tax=Agaricus bisporus var. bisporus (strain H97 / ATCC MYA-4626 / FGSC 10389) TaxID=936046 RepID=UPI00029F62AD|nr:hypothetical protein AGABI2DRAFT_116710 [Agaricus bisporus var. bisporus H97]EKV47896.1 hypothetical protein AGABI2DRAFT_116710 [Agaricus bisporus var. bisporus H97]
MSDEAVATVTQLFYAHRIYALSKTKVITGIVIILAVGQAGLGLASTMLLLGIPGSIVPASMPIFGWGPVGVVCDLVIAIYMSCFFTKQMRRSSRTMQVMVTRIKRLVLETGLLTAVVATAYPLLFAFLGHDEYIIPGLILGKVYSNSILVLLNNRFTIVGGRNEPIFEFEADSYHLSDLPRRESTQDGRE